MILAVTKQDATGNCQPDLETATAIMQLMNSALAWPSLSAVATIVNAVKVCGKIFQNISPSHHLSPLSNSNSFLQTAEEIDKVYNIFVDQMSLCNTADIPYEVSHIVARRSREACEALVFRTRELHRENSECEPNPIDKSFLMQQIVLEKTATTQAEANTYTTKYQLCLIITLIKSNSNY